MPGNKGEKKKLIPSRARGTDREVDVHRERQITRQPRRKSGDGTLTPDSKKDGTREARGKPAPTEGKGGRGWTSVSSSHKQRRLDRHFLVEERGYENCMKKG